MSRAQSSGPLYTRTRTHTRRQAQACTHANAHAHRLGTRDKPSWLQISQLRRPRIILDTSLLLHQHGCILQAPLLPSPPTTSTPSLDRAPASSPASPSTSSSIHPICKSHITSHCCPLTKLLPPNSICHPPLLRRKLLSSAGDLDQLMLSTHPKTACLGLEPRAPHTVGLGRTVSSCSLFHECLHFLRTENVSSHHRAQGPHKC